MSIFFRLGDNQLDNLSVIRDLGPEKIQSIIDSLSGPDFYPRRPSDLEKTLKEVFKEKDDIVDVVIKTLISLYTLRRQRNISPSDLVKGLYSGIKNAKEPWDDELLKKWKSIEPNLIDLFSLSSIWMVVKSLDLSYDYENLLQNIKIITDIRPIYNEDASVINSCIVAFSLRIYYDSLAGSKSLSISIDKEDVIKLRDACDRALLKSDTAKEFLIKSNIKSVGIIGEEDD